MKKMKKIIPALGMLMLSASMLGTSTFAWFSMNNKVTVTGMEVTTKVGNNLYIVDTKVADPTAATYGTSLVNKKEALLEPVSSINGQDDSFYYNATSNVAGNGSAITKTYTSYNSADTTAFDTAYGTTGAVGYVDYVFTLKAVNASTSKAQDVIVSKLALTYGAKETSGVEAFRVAVLTEEYTTAYQTLTTTTVLGASGAAYFESNKAVSDTDATAAVVNYGTAAKIGTVAVATSEGPTIGYYAVTVRLWLEGEDKKCTSDTFAALTDKWALDLEVSMLDTTTGSPVTAIATSATATKVDLTSGYSVDAETTKVINGVTYYNLKKDDAGTAYYIDTATLTATTHVFTITDNVYLTDVTNQCTLPSA